MMNTTTGALFQKGKTFRPFRHFKNILLAIFARFIQLLIEFRTKEDQDDEHKDFFEL